MTYTNIGKEAGYEEEKINQAIKRVEWENFRTENLPFMQGEAIKNVVKQCKIPLTGIQKMALHETIVIKDEEHGFYALDVKYKNGQAKIYVADSGCECCVVASDFTPCKRCDDCRGDCPQD